MTTTISKVAYKAVWDSSNLAKGLMGSRAMFLEQKKILASMQTPMDRYTQAQQNLVKMLEKYPAIQQHKLNLEKQIEKQYLTEEAALRKLSGTEKSRLWQLMNQDEKAAARKAGLQKMEESQRRIAEAKEREHQTRIQAIRRNSEDMERARRDSALAKEREHQTRIQAIRRNSEDMERARRDSALAKEREHQTRIQAIRRNSEDMERARRDSALAKEREHQKRLQMIRYNSADMERARLKAVQEQEAKDRAGVTVLGRDPRIAAAALAAGAGFGAQKMVSEGIDAYRSLERVEAAFNVFSGSLAESRDLIQQIRDLSAQTGVSFAGLSDGAKTLMLRDINAKETVSMMQKIAIVTGGNTDNMKSMALAMGQINQAGKLMGQELIQLVNAGWTPMEEISKKTGIAMADLRKEMEQGNISFQMVTDALEAAVSEGGRYFGFLESLEGTTARAADKTASAWEQASARIGAAFKPVSLAWSELSSGFAGGSADLFEGLGSWLSTYFDRETAIKNQISAWESSGGNAMVGMIGRESTDLNAKLAFGMKRARDFDAMMKAEQEAKQKALEADQKAAAAKEAALKPTEAGSSLIRLANIELDKERILTMKLNEGETDRVKLLQQRLELSEKLSAQAERMAALKESGASEPEIKEILNFEEKLHQMRTERERTESQLAASKKVADKYRSPDDRIVDELADLELARRRGAMSQPEFDRASLGLVQDRSTTNMRVGSQEAYQFMAGVQDRGKREEMARHRETVRLQGLMLKAIERLDSTMQNLEPVGVAG